MENACSICSRSATSVANLVACYKGTKRMMEKSCYTACYKAATCSATRSEGVQAVFDLCDHY